MNNDTATRASASRLVKFRNRASATGIMATPLAMGAFPAFAFDETAIVAKIVEYGATAVLIVGAFILALWGVKALGLLKKG